MMNGARKRSGATSAHLDDVNNRLLSCLEALDDLDLHLPAAHLDMAIHALAQARLAEQS